MNNQPKKRFNVGDLVWVAHFNPNQPIRIPCGVCFGQKKVTLILGNGDHVELPCEYCANGFESPRGYEEEYHPVSESQQIRIDSIHIQCWKDKEVVEYHQGSSGCYYSYPEDKVFGTKEEADIKSKELMEEWLAERQRSSNYIKSEKKKSFAWNAGYHMREVKRLEKQIEIHKEKAKLCRERKRIDGQSDSVSEPETQS